MERKIKRQNSPSIPLCGVMVLGHSWSQLWAEGSTRVVEHSQEQGLEWMPLLWPAFCGLLTS